MLPYEVWSANMLNLDGTPSSSQSPKMLDLDSEMLFINDTCNLQDSLLSIASSSQSSYPSNVEVVDTSIHWHKIPDYIMKSCKKGEKLSPTNYNQFVAIIVDASREFDRYITKKTFANRAKLIVDKYPKTFQDFDEDGTIIGDGNGSLLMKLINRNNYRNRPHKSTFTQQIFKKTTKSKTMRQKLSGSVNWQPNVPENCNMGEKKTYLKLGASDPRFDQDKLMEIFIETYPQQRMDINMESSVQDMLANWPILFQEKYLMNHFSKLVNIDIDACLDNIPEKMKVISSVLLIFLFYKIS